MESSTAKNSPTRRNIAGTSDRIARLSAFAAAVDKPSLGVDEMRRAVGELLWDGYWARLDDIKQLMDLAQDDAERICAILDAEFEKKVPRISN
jgi:hypothetical protein